MYHETFEFLERIGLNKESDDQIVQTLWRMRESHAYRRIIAEQVERVVAQQLPVLARQGQVDGFNLLINGRPLESNWSENAGVAIKKMLSFSTMSFIQNGTIMRDSFSTHENPSLKWDKGINFFVRFLLNYRPLVERNMIVPFPSVVEREMSSRYIDRQTSFAGDLLRVDLEYDLIRNQFFELASLETNRSNSLITLYLPHVSMSRLESLVELRDSERDAFIIYQRYLADFFKKSKEANTEQEILDCMREVDTGIRRINTTFEALKKKQRFQEVALIVGLATTFLCVVGPPEVAELLLAAVGGATSIKVLEYFASQNSEMDALRDNQFYFPWLIAYND